MVDGNVYYCWCCDAHRRAASGSSPVVNCPSCGQPLTEDSRLPHHAEPPLSAFFRLDQAIAERHTIANSWHLPMSVAPKK